MLEPVARGDIELFAKSTHITNPPMSDILPQSNNYEALDTV